MTRRTYTTMSSARRALSKIGEKALHAAKTLIQIDEEDRYYFDDVDAESIQDCDCGCDAELKDVEEAPTEDTNWAAANNSLPDETINPEDEEELAAELDEELNKAASRAKSATQGESMKSSIKLDRRIAVRYTENGEQKYEQYKNAYQMWKANPTWMTSAQQDRLTATLYAAAKKGEYKTVEINERTFVLVSV